MLAVPLPPSPSPNSIVSTPHVPRARGMCRVCTARCLQGEFTVTGVRSWNRLPSENGINITTTDKRTYYFLAPSPAAKADWMRAIQSGVDLAAKLKSGEAEGPSAGAGKQGGGAGAPVGAKSLARRGSALPLSEAGACACALCH